MQLTSVKMTFYSVIVEGGRKEGKRSLTPLTTPNIPAGCGQVCCRQPQNISCTGCGRRAVTRLSKYMKLLVTIWTIQQYSVEEDYRAQSGLSLSNYDFLRLYVIENKLNSNFCWILGHFSVFFGYSFRLLTLFQSQ